MPADMPAPIILPAPILVGPDAKPVVTVPTPMPAVRVEVKGRWVRVCQDGTCRWVFVRE